VLHPARGATVLRTGRPPFQTAGSDA